MDEEEAIDEARDIVIEDLARQVRAAQKKYFQTRDRSVLIKCKQLERKLDDALANG